MRKDALIQRLARLSGNPQIVIIDTERNARDIDGQSVPEGSSEGIYTDFEIRYMGKEDLADGCSPVIGLLVTPDPEPAFVNALERLFKLEAVGFFHHVVNSGKPSEQISSTFRCILNDLRKFVKI